MNADPFEERLQRQTFRKPPASWRADILQAARKAQGRSAHETTSTPVANALGNWLTAWLWPHPRAWAGLAACWFVILAAHALSPNSHLPAQTVATARDEALARLLQAQRRLLADLMNPADADAAPGPFRTPRPRSQTQPPSIGA